jgi:hypothetical protein
MFGLSERVMCMIDYGDHINAKRPVIHFALKVLAVIPTVSTGRPFTESNT